MPRPQSLTKLDLSKFHFGMFATVDVAGAHCFVTRTGYTGEDGFEISVPNEKALHLTERLCANNFVKLCGECTPCAMTPSTSMLTQRGIPPNRAWAPRQPAPGGGAVPVRKRFG